MHSLQMDVLLSTLYCIVLYTAQQYSIFTGYLGVSIKAACNWYCKKCQAIMMETKVKIIERVEQGEKMADIACSCNTELLSVQHKELTDGGTGDPEKGWRDKKKK